MNTPLSRPGPRRRVFPRKPLNGPVEFRNGPDGLKEAACRNVGRGGICLKSPEMLKPGKPILLDFSRWLGEVPEAECLARVVWAESTDHGCVVGVRIYHDQPSVGETLAVLVQQALVQSAGSEGSKPPLWEMMTPRGYPGARAGRPAEGVGAAVPA